MKIFYKILIKDKGWYLDYTFSTFIEAVKFATRAFSIYPDDNWQDYWEIKQISMYNSNS